MLRELDVTMNKPATAQYKSAADVNIITGMGVVKNEADQTFSLPTAETAADIFLVDRERVVEGYKAAYDNLSDYDEDYVTVEPGTFAKLIAYYVGERIAVDQLADDVSSYAEGDRMSVGTDGKWMKASSGVSSKYVFKAIYTDASHELALIEISDTPAENA